jgi:hypothetical protein
MGLGVGEGGAIMGEQLGEDEGVGDLALSFLLQGDVRLGAVSGEEGEL